MPQGNYTVDADLEEVYKITPMLSVFFGGKNTTMSSTAAQLSCLKVVTEEHPDDADNSSKGAAPPLVVNLLGVVVAVFATVLFTLA